MKYTDILQETEKGQYPIPATEEGKIQSIPFLEPLGPS